MTIVLLLLALAETPAQKDCKAQFAPLETGAYSGASRVPFWRKSEAGEWGRPGWIGWMQDGDRLQAVQLTVRDRPKDHPDDNDVNVLWTPDVTYAVRCIPRLGAGPIRSLRVARRDLDYGPLTFSLGSRRYDLRLQSAREDRTDARVILSDGRDTQVLYSADGFVDEPHYFIEWAGDLDRDGRLDLVVNLSRKYSWHPYRLLLSSAAAPGQLVADVAVFETGD